MEQNRRSADSIIELLYDEFKIFRTESKEDIRTLREAIETKNRILEEHTEQLIKLNHTIHGNGTKGLADRLQDLEKAYQSLTEEVREIKTKEKIKECVLGVICAICSTVGGILAYALSVYLNFIK